MFYFLNNIALKNKDKNSFAPFLRPFGIKNCFDIAQSLYFQHFQDYSSSPTAGIPIKFHIGSSEAGNALFSGVSGLFASRFGSSQTGIFAPFLRPFAPFLRPRNHKLSGQKTDLVELGVILLPQLLGDVKVNFSGDGTVFMAKPAGDLIHGESRFVKEGSMGVAHGMGSDVFTRDLFGVALKVHPVGAVLDMSSITVKHKQRGIFSKTTGDTPAVHKSKDCPAGFQQLRLDVDVTDRTGALCIGDDFIIGVVLLGDVDFQSIEIHVAPFQGAGLAETQAGESKEFCQELPFPAGDHILHNSRKLLPVKVFVLDLFFVRDVLEIPDFAKKTDVLDIVVVVCPAEHGPEPAQELIQSPGASP